MKLFLSLVFCLIFGGVARADKYYCVIFSQDSAPISIPFFCHIWGTFVHSSDNGKLMKEITISWEPERISYVDKRQTGFHSTLYGCLDHAQKKKSCVRMWGPYEIDKELFLRAEGKYHEPGKYKFLDGCSRKDACNCIHRLSDIAGNLKTGIRWGWWAADRVDRFMKEKNLVRPAEDKNDVVKMLRLHHYCIRRM